MALPTNPDKSKATAEDYIVREQVLMAVLSRDHTGRY